MNDFVYAPRWDANVFGYTVLAEVEGFHELFVEDFAGVGDVKLFQW